MASYNIQHIYLVGTLTFGFLFIIELYFCAKLQVSAKKR